MASATIVISGTSRREVGILKCAVGVSESSKEVSDRFGRGKYNGAEVFEDSGDTERRAVSLLQKQRQGLHEKGIENCLELRLSLKTPFPVKKSQPVGGSYNNHSPGPCRTVPRFPSSRTERRKPIQCYGCETPGVIKLKCPTCTIFREKIAVCADTGASHTIAGEKLFKFLQEHNIIFANKIISFMMADGIRQIITALSAVVNLYIEGKVIPTEFLVLPEAKGNKTLLERDFLNAAESSLTSKAENDIFLKILVNITSSSRSP
ncbi:retrovirus-related Pol polyprotein from transposon 297 [Nephila pilipes]|uniref:Retrovirus-related Pol polyprotein from transposon 297 n=1 Tax=Nephila pilipes TaxID=299642 RepID=A0A8X6JWR4_NEPPI|nr:retrovirus-related Pol polyprotein from transposon 297 [Nephila pilipes]